MKSGPILTAAMRRKKGRSDALLRALRYQPAYVYSEMEKLYTDDPDYEDVAERLGM